MKPCRHLISLACGLLAGAASALADSSCLDWSRIPQAAGSTGHAMAYDAARGEVVRFGGYGATQLVNAETWLWDGVKWIQRTPASSPPPRYGQAMAYDSARGVTVMFGGYNGGVFGDTWEWDGTDWAQRLPVSSPPARTYHSMAFDSSRGVIVLFGGSNGAAYLGDTWEWNGTNWTQRTPAASPHPRFGAPVAYDSARGVTVLFGGYYQDNGNWIVNDTWEWNGTTWTQRAPASSPSRRAFDTLVYDTARGVAVLFGGYNYGLPQDATLGDTWEWNGSNWTQRTSVTSPSVRSGHAAAYDAGRSVTVVFGGYNPSEGFPKSTWTWNGTSWEKLGGSPSSRYAHALAYDVARQETVLFGGSTGNNETWAWNGVDWTQRHPAHGPPGRWFHALAYDDARGVTVLYGGADEHFSNEFDDTWEWDGTDWTQRSPPVSPPARGQHAMAYDSARAVMVMFGGYGGGIGDHGDTWEWNGTSWTQRNSPHSPSARSGHAMAYDSARGVTVLSAGRSDVSSTFSDTWEWNGADWTVRNTTSSPSSYFHAMSYDSARDVTVLFGGTNGGSGGSQTWEWDGNAWTQPAPANSPPGLYLHAMAYDVDRAVTVLVGGAYSDDTWEFSGSLGAPNITQHPAEQSPWPQGTATFTVEARADGNPPLGYQWRKDGVELVDGSNIAGATTATLTISPVSRADLGYYDVVVFDPCGSVTSSAASLVLRAPLDIKPGECPNRLARSNRGILQIALLGSSDFDVSRVFHDPYSGYAVWLSRADGVGYVAPREGRPGSPTKVTDIGTPYMGATCGCNELGADGRTDLVFNFVMDELTSSLGLGTWNSAAPLELVLRGWLDDGTTFIASDCVRILPPPR